MKNLVLTIFAITLGIIIGKAEDPVIKLSGVYQGENLYVMNPFAPSNVGFCAYEVKVNGKTTTDEVNSSAFEIDLSIYNFKIGDKIEIEILHKKGCTPQVLNPEAIKPKSTFNIENIKLSKNGIITWTTSGEAGSLPFYVEQFKWNKWVRVAKVNGKGTPDVHTYSAKVHFITGENRFRVKQVDYTKKPRYSPEVKYVNFAKEVTFKPGDGKKVSRYIEFSSATDYEIFNYYGQLVKKGYATKVDLSNLKSGTYFLNYDNKTATFEKK